MVASRLTTSIIHFLLGWRKNPWVLGAKKKEWACENGRCNSWPASRKTRAGDEDRDWRWCSTCCGSDGGSGRCCLITGVCCCLVFRGWCVLLVRGIALCHHARSTDAGSEAWHYVKECVCASVMCIEFLSYVLLILILYSVFRSVILCVSPSSVWDL